MPLRSQAKIRRDINRLDALIAEHAAVHAALAAIQPEVSAAAARVNTTWRAFQSAAITASREIEERDSASAALLSWARAWRGVVIIKVPGALENIRDLPASGATPDDVVRLATDLKTIIDTRPQAEPFRASANAELGTKLEDAARETKEANAALPAKQAARAAFAAATLEPTRSSSRAARLCGTSSAPSRASTSSSSRARARPRTRKTTATPTRARTTPTSSWSSRRPPPEAIRDADRWRRRAAAALTAADRDRLRADRRSSYGHRPRSPSDRA